MMNKRRLFTQACILASLTTSAAHAAGGPVACEATADDWWSRQIYRAAHSDGKFGLQMAGGNKALVVWSDGTEQLVTVAELEGLGVCATDRVTVEANDVQG